MLISSEQNLNHILDSSGLVDRHLASPNHHRPASSIASLGYRRTEASAASAALSNSPSSHSFAPRSPETTSRAQATYSSLRFTDQSGDGLAVIALRLLVLS